MPRKRATAPPAAITAPSCQFHFDPVCREAPGITYAIAASCVVPRPDARRASILPYGPNGDSVLASPVTPAGSNTASEAGDSPHLRGASNTIGFPAGDGGIDARTSWTV